MSKFEPVFNQLLESFSESFPFSYQNSQFFITGYYQSEDVKALEPIIKYFNGSKQFFSLYAQNNQQTGTTNLCLDLYVLELIRLYSFKTVFKYENHTENNHLIDTLQNIEVNRLKSKVKLGINGTLVSLFNLNSALLSPFSSNTIQDFNLDKEQLSELTTEIASILQQWSASFKNNLFKLAQDLGIDLEKIKQDSNFTPLLQQLLDLCHSQNLDYLYLSDLESTDFKLDVKLRKFILNLIYANNSVAIVDLKDLNELNNLADNYYAYALQKVLIKNYTTEFTKFLQQQAYAQLFYSNIDVSNSAFKELLESKLAQYIALVLTQDNYSKINHSHCQSFAINEVLSKYNHLANGQDPILSNLNNLNSSYNLDNSLQSSTEDKTQINTVYIVFIPKSKTELLGILQQIKAQHLSLSSCTNSNNFHLYLVGENTAGIKSVNEILTNLDLTPPMSFSANRCRIYVFNNFNLTYSFVLKQKSTAYAYNNFSIASLNGVFGDDKIDVATDLLLSTYQDLKSPYNQHLAKVINFNDIHLEDNEQKQHNFLDYGCGSGIITKYLANFLDKKLTLRQQQTNKIVDLKLNFDLIDVFYPALLTTKYNLTNHHFTQNLRFNLFHQTRLKDNNFNDFPNIKYREIVSNPPFHEGKEQTFEITERLVQDACNLLDYRGVLRLVANSHLPYLSIIKKYFKFVDIIANQNGFTVYYAKNWK